MTLLQARPPGVSPQALKAAAFELSPEPALVIGPTGAVAAANDAAEAMFGHGLALLFRGDFRAALPADAPLSVVIDRAVREGARVREYGVSISLFGLPTFEADAAAAPLGEGSVLLTLHLRGTHGDRAADAAGLRSVEGLGRMLAHEIKNPLAGIRGAAQLLKTGATAEDQPLAQLIMDETDRVKRLVDRMETFADDAPPTRQPVNIHEVLDRVRALCVNGVADGLEMKIAFDPSLPLAYGEEDQLIQVFLNLVKNAAEAAHARGDGQGEISITTAWRHGIRVKTARGYENAPLEVKITDNGPGVPVAMRDHLFQPFVTTKTNGAGLGLALVAKLVSAHGGMIDFVSEPGRTSFRVLLPVTPEGASA